MSSSVSHGRTVRPVVCSLVTSAQETQRHNSENEQVRTLLDRQSEQLLADTQAETQKHEFQADYDRRSFQKLSETIESQQEELSSCSSRRTTLTKIPPDDILEGLYKLRIRESEKLKTELELYDVEIHRKKLGPDYHRLKTMVKRSIEQDIRNKNFGARNGNYEKNAVVKNPVTKQRVQRFLGDCWQWKANGQCSKGDNCSFRHDINKRVKTPSPSSSTRKNERNASKTRSPRGKSPSGRMSRWSCKEYLKGTYNNSFCDENQCFYQKSS